MQRFGRSVKSSHNSSFVKGLVLLLVLVGIIFFYRGVRTKGVPPQFSSMLSSEFENYRNLVEIDTTISDSIKKAFSGFWVRDVGDSVSPVKITDHLELKDNGIFWQVIRWDVSFLNSDILTLYHIRYGYMNPFSRSTDTDDIICDVRTIRQILIVGEDTCYGASQIDQMWRDKKNGEQFELNKKKYHRYSGSVQQFFPEGIIDGVDKIGNSQCRSGSALSPYAKKFIQNEFEISTEGLLPDSRRIINEYYDRFLKEELIESLPIISTIPDSIQLIITIQPDGVVKNVAIQGEVIVKSKIEEFVLREASSWKFPVRRTVEPLEVKHVIYF